MPVRKTKETLEAARTSLLTMLSEPSTENTIYMQQVEQLRLDYPDVPEPENQTWSYSDRFTRQTASWIEQLQEGEKALLRAATIYREMLCASARTTLEERDRNNSAFSAAIFLTEDIQTEYNFMFPMPTNRNAPKQKKDPLLQGFYPQLLLNTQDQVVIWLPTLPSKSRGIDSHIYGELLDLLFENEFSHFGKWHCDFFHFFRPRENEESLLGIRDVDNYAYKPIIDALARAFSTKDCSDHFSCSMYNMISSKVHPGCYIRIIKRTEKVQFFSEFENLAFALNPSKS